MGSAITIYGSHTCEDTAFVRDRLLTLGIPFSEHDKEDSESVQQMLVKYSRGAPHTPTIVVGDESKVLIEPTVQELEDALGTAGYPVHIPNVVQFDAQLAGRPAPDFELPSTTGNRFELGQLRGWRRSVLFFAHDHSCRVCQGYARQISKFQVPWSEMETRLLIVLQDNVDRSRNWAEEFANGAQALADTDGAVKASFTAYFAPFLNSRPEGTVTLILDRYTAPRVGSFASDAGGLIAPYEVDRWLHLLDYECDE